MVHDEPLKTTESFTYLGSTVMITNTNSADLGSGKEDPIHHEGLWCATKETLEL